MTNKKKKTEDDINYIRNVVNEVQFFKDVSQLLNEDEIEDLLKCFRLVEMDIG